MTEVGKIALSQAGGKIYVNFHPIPVQLQRFSTSKLIYTHYVLLSTKLFDDRSPGNNGTKGGDAKN